MLSFLGRGVINAPCREVAAFVKKVENNLTWDRFLVVSFTSLLLLVSSLVYFTIIIIISIGCEVCENYI